MRKQIFLFFTLSFVLVSCFEQSEYPEDYNSVTALIYGDGKFIAGFVGKKMSVSSNGTDWKSIKNPYESYISAMAYGDGIYVACSISGEIAYSYDGEDWHLAHDSTFETSNIYSICYGNDKFVAVGQNGKIAYSVDGVNWIVANTAFGKYDEVRAITYGDGKFIAGSIYQSNGMITYYIAYSIDGIDWPSKQISEPIYSLSYGNNKFICGSINKIIYSLDGLSWIESNNLSFEKHESIRSITYGNDIYLAVGGGGNIAYSSNGIEWKGKKHGINTYGFLSTTYGNGKFLVGDWNGNISVFNISEF